MYSTHSQLIKNLYCRRNVRSRRNIETILTKKKKKELAGLRKKNNNISCFPFWTNLAYRLMVTWVAFLYGKVRRQVVDGQTFPNTEGSCEYVQQARQCTYTRNNEASSRNHCCCGKAISITYSGGGLCL